MPKTHACISIPSDLHEQAQKSQINISKAAVIGIRVHLGLSCLVVGGCNCKKKSDKLQELLLTAQDNMKKLDENYRRLKLYVQDCKNKEKT